ncbi:MAG: sulfotransferase, partial [Sphingomonadaceae bacterium]
MSGPALWGGQALRRWLAEGGRPARPSPLLSPARAMAFEAALALQRRLPPPPPLDPSPIFVLGFWRSGTTLLHELLAALPGHVAPQTWQCFRPAALRLAPPPAEREAVRPMDGRPVGTGTPQEDEFALLLLGALSLYRGFLDPRRLDELVPLLNGSDGGDWIGPFEAFARAVLALAPGPRRLVVKSPTHLFRQASLRTRWPAAPLLVPLRDPAASWASALGMWREMVALHGLWPAPDGALEQFLARAFAAA